MYVQRAVLVIARDLSYILSALHSVFYTMSCCKHSHSYGKLQGNVPYFSRFSHLWAHSHVIYLRKYFEEILWGNTSSHCGMDCCCVSLHSQFLWEDPHTLDHWWCLWSRFTWVYRTYIDKTWTVCNHAYHSNYHSHGFFSCCHRNGVPHISQLCYITVHTASYHSWG